MSEGLFEQLLHFELHFNRFRRLCDRHGTSSQTDIDRCVDHWYIELAKRICVATLSHHLPLLLSHVLVRIQRQVLVQ